MRAQSYAAIFLSLFAVSACGGGSSGSPAPAAPAIPTVQAVSLDAAQLQALEPLADGAVWNYRCASGATPQITVKQFGTVLGTDTFIETSPLPVGRASSAAGSVILANTNNGTLQYFGYVLSGVFTAVPAAITAEDPTPAAGATYVLPEQSGGTVTTVFQSVQSVTVPAATYSTAYAFHNSYSTNSQVTADFYDVRGVGTVQINYTSGSTHDSCLLTSTNVVPAS